MGLRVSLVLALAAAACGDGGGGGGGGSVCREIDVTSAAALTDFQVQVVVDTATPIGDGDMQPDCGDLRVLTADGLTELPYWIEGPCNDVATSVWVKVPAVPMGASTLLLRYGGQDQSSASDPDATFIAVIGGVTDLPLAAAWSFDDQAAATDDLSGNGNDGLVMGGAMWQAEGKYGGSFALDGVDGRLVIPDSPTLDAGTFTFEGWFRPSAIQPSIVAARDNAGADGWELWLDHPAAPGVLSLHYDLTGMTDTIIGTTSITPDTWFHIAVIYTGAQFELHVNTGTDGTTPWSGGIAPSFNDALTIGSDSAAGSPFPGAIDEIHFWNRVLTPAELSSIYTHRSLATPYYPNHLLLRSTAAEDPSASIASEIQCP